jgi:hypothetical protein
MSRPYLTNVGNRTIEERLDQLQDLYDGWFDGQGKAVNPVTIALARAVLPKLFHGRPEHKVHIYPTPNGGINVEVDQKTYSYGILFFGDENQVEATCSYWAVDKEDPELLLCGLSADDYLLILDDWIEHL